jgi:hypothetical protein
VERRRDDRALASVALRRLVAGRLPSGRFVRKEDHVQRGSDIDKWAGVRRHCLRGRHGWGRAGTGERRTGRDQVCLDRRGE